MSKLNRWPALAMLALLGTGGAGHAQPDDCDDTACMQAAFADCRGARYTAAGGPLGAAEYEILPTSEPGCAVMFEYSNNPNPAWVGKPLILVLDNAQPLAPQLKAAVGACLTGGAQADARYQCNGPLAGIAGGGGAPAPAGGPQFADGPLAESPCGKAVTETFPERLKWYDRDKQLWGYVDRSGQWIIPAQWPQATRFSEGRAFVTETSETGDLRWSLIDTRGEYVARRVHDAKAKTTSTLNDRKLLTHPTAGFSEGCAAFEPRYGGFYLDRDGRAWLPEPTQSMQAAAEAAGGVVHDIGGFHAGRARFAVNIRARGTPDLRHGYIDRAGAVVIAPTYYKAGDFDADKRLAPVGLYDPAAMFDEGEWLFIDRAGNPARLAGVELAEAGAFSEGWAPVQIGRRWTYTDGQRLLATDKPRWYWAGAFQNGHAMVGGDGFAFINIRGEVVKTLASEAVCWLDYQRFREGLILALLADDARGCGHNRRAGDEAHAEHGHWAYLDTAGAIVLREQRP